MPKINDSILKKSNSKANKSKSKSTFVAKPYRPWDIYGTGNFTQPDNSDVPANQINNSSITDVKQTDNKKLNKTNVNSKTNQKQTRNDTETHMPPNTSLNKPKLTYPDTHNIPTTDIEQIDSGYATDIQQIYNSSKTNIKHSYNKPISEHTSNQYQTDINPTTNQQHSYIVSETNPVTETETVVQQTYNKKMGFNRVSGLQKNILLLIFKECERKGSLITSPFKTDLLTELLGCSYGTIKTTIGRLKKIGYLYLEDFKAGRSGWSIYRLNEQTYREISDYKKLHETVNFNVQQSENIHTTNMYQNYNNYRSYSTTEPTTALSNNSNNHIKENINTTNNELPEEWNQIDTEPLKEKNIHFGKNQLKQLYKLNMLTPDKIQASIFAFSHEIEHNEAKGIEKRYGQSKLNYLMGILRKGNEYLPVDGYESPEEIAMREQLERLKAKRQRKEKMIAELKEYHFEEWLEKADEAIFNDNIPMYDGNRYRPSVKMLIKSYFDENVFPDIQKDMLTE